MLEGHVRTYLSRIGAKGGAAGTGAKKARPSEVCRAAGKKSAAVKAAKRKRWAAAVRRKRP